MTSRTKHHDRPASPALDGNPVDLEEPLEAFSGVRDLRESAAFRELQALVDDSQATPNVGRLPQLVDLALFRETDLPSAR